MKCSIRVGPWLERARLAAQLRDTLDWATRFDVVERAILERFAKAPDIDPGVRWAWNQIRRSGGSTEIGGLCSELGRSRKQLIAGFREELGLAPKTLARVVRFSQAVDLLRIPGRTSMADVAYQCGYFDQAHFARDFRQFAGATPTEFVAHLLPDNGGFVIN